MKRTILYTSLITLGVASIAVWQFWPQASSIALKINEEVEEFFSHGEHHDHDHHHHHDEEEEQVLVKISPEKIRDIGITIREAGPGVLNIDVSTRGKIVFHPDRLAHILPKVSGIAIEAKKNIGEKVYQGDLLAVLESREMADIKAEFLSALQKERLAKATFDREERLFRKKISAGQDFLSAKSAYEVSKLDVQLARHKLFAYGIDDQGIEKLANQRDPNLSRYEIRAPIEGTIIGRHITQGEYIENTSQIYEIADLSNVWIEIGVFPKDLYKIQQGQKVTVSQTTNKTQALAQLIYLSPIIQDETITATAIAQLDNAGGIWRPGTYVKVNIAVETLRSPLVVSKEAIQNIEGVDYVFIVTDEGFEKRPVKTGRSDATNIEIISGIPLGQKYAAAKTFILKADLGKNSVEHED